MGVISYVYDPAMRDTLIPNTNIFNYTTEDAYEGSYIKRTLNTEQTITSFGFNGCDALIKVLEVDISDVNYLSYMFCDCVNLEEVTLTGLSFDNKPEQDFYTMFKNCPKLKRVDISDVQNTEHIQALINDIDKYSRSQEVYIVLNPVVAYNCNDGINCFITYELEKTLPKYKNYYYFGNYISIDNFINKGNYPKEENGYFTIDDKLYLLEDGMLFMVGGKFLGSFTTLDDITEIGYVDMYGDLYYRGADASCAKVKGRKYGGKYYHTIGIDGWEEICTSLNELKNANDGKLDNDIIDADHSYTSYFLDEKFKQLINDAKVYVEEKQQEKVTVAYVDQCPTFTKMKLNEMYIVPEFDNNNEIAYFNRYMKINNNGTEELWNMGQVGHFQENYYTKERADELFVHTNTIAYLNNLGVASDTIYRVLTGTRKVNKRTVATTIHRDTDYEILKLTTANGTVEGLMKRRTLNGMHEILIEVTVLKDEPLSDIKLDIEKAIELPIQTISALNGPVINFRAQLAKDNPTSGSITLPAANVAGVLINALNLKLYTKDDAGYEVGTKLYGYLVYPVWGKDVF